MATFTYEQFAYRFKNPTVDGNLDLLDDGAIIKIAADDDLQLTHSGSVGDITCSTGALDINAGTVNIKDEASSETMASFVSDGAVTLNHDNTARLATTSAGCEVTGTLAVSGTSAFTGKITSDNGIDIDNINIDGTTIALSSGDLTVDVAGDISLDAAGDNIRLKYDGTQVGQFKNVSSDLEIHASVQDKDIKFKGDDTDLTITSGAKINLTATSDVHIPNNVGIVFGGDSEKIEGDGTDMTISANNLTIDAAADITLDAAGNDLNFAAGGTTVLTVSNSSSDVVIKPVVDAKDLIFQQRDGTEVMRIEDGAHVAFTAAALNPEATLTDASTISWNVLTSPVAKVTLGANRTLGAGTGGVAGSFQSLLVIQDGTGSRSLTFNAAYEFKDDTAPTLTTTANKGDLFVFRYNGSKFLEVGRNQNLTLS